MGGEEEGMGEWWEFQRWPQISHPQGTLGRRIRVLLGAKL